MGVSKSLKSLTPLLHVRRPPYFIQANWFQPVYVNKLSLLFNANSREVEGRPAFSFFEGLWPSTKVCFVILALLTLGNSFELTLILLWVILQPADLHVSEKVLYRVQDGHTKNRVN